MKKTAFAESAVAELARRADIELDYLNAAGERVGVVPEVIRAVLATIGCRVEDDHDAQDILDRLDRDSTCHIVPPVLVLREDHQPAQIPVHLEAHRNHCWRVLREDGEIAQEGTIERLNAPNPDEEVSLQASQITLTVRMACGYHRFELDDETMSLIVVPAKCWLEPIERGQKLWSIAAQLYLLKSERNWGIGDFTDLRTLIDIAAGWGASLIGLNPLHALFVDEPEQASPYAPASRLYLNVLNIDVTAIPEFATCEDAQALVGNVDFAGTLARVRAEKMVNYRRAAKLKLRVLRLIHSHFLRVANPERRQALEAFVGDRGESLKRFSIFQAIRLEMARTDPSAADWEQWPAELRQPDSTAVQAFAEQHRKDVEFFTWAQWIADTQLDDASRHARAHQMSVGLYRDLAVGSSGAGAETWSNPQVVVAGAHAGAPPDLLNPSGQDWGLPPFNPRALRKEAYAPFIELVRANMRHSGALRIDHVIGLQHLYWIPVGYEASQGAYISYPFEDLLGIIALESHRNRCLVIGEDLGTVPPGFSEKLNAHGILSNRVLYFQQDPESGKFLPPREYVQLALASIGSHDLATLKGWWLGIDIVSREQLQLYPNPLEAANQRRTRHAEKQQLLTALRLEGLDPGNADDFESLSRAVHAFLARSRSAIAMVEMDNLTGEVSQINLPTTSVEHPNWRRRYSMSLEELGNDTHVNRIIETIQLERPRTDWNRT
jgi:4-alpha-glucanotransferase